MSSASHSVRIALLTWLVLCALAGCARQPYVARPLVLPGESDRDTHGKLASPALQEYMRAHGAPGGPAGELGLSELTLIALFGRPELEAARARARAAQADAEQAAARPPIGISPRIEHHSAANAGDTPWSLGFELDLPLPFASRRAPLMRRAQAQAEIAGLEVGALVWQLRSEVRARLVDVWSSRLREASNVAEADVQQSVVAMLEKRRELGYASSSEVDAARLRLADARAGAAAARSEVQLALGRLAQALGIPLAALPAAQLTFGALTDLADAPDMTEARTRGLRNRTDLQRGLLDFEAADAEVKLQIAQQYPTLALRPGFLWDQGDRVWSLALDLVLPASLTHGAAIRAAGQRREAAAQQVLALQQAILGEIETRLTTYRAARSAAEAAQAAAQIQATRTAQVTRQFDAGQVDRFERTLAQAEHILAQRRAEAARLEAQRALGLLEDALQAPLAGGPLPAAHDDRGRR